MLLAQLVYPGEYDAPGKLSRIPTMNVSRAEPLLSSRLQHGGGLFRALSRLRSRQGAPPPVATPSDASDDQQDEDAERDVEDRVDGGLRCSIRATTTRARDRR